MKTQQGAARQKPAQPLNDPSHLILGKPGHVLDPFFSPSSVAVIGASERPGSVGRALFSNLLEGGFQGGIYPVNPRHRSVLGRTAFSNVASLPEKVDLAVVAAPAAAVPGLIRECASAGLGAVAVISAGFKESGPRGEALEIQVAEAARAGGIRLLGPNCLGLMRPSSGLNASFAAQAVLPGKLALVSQSGALITSILDWSLREKVGFSAVVSAGAMSDLGWGDFIDFLGDDPQTESILLYMESVGDARRFLSVAREVALNKPILVLKAGRSAEGARAASSHTGALTGSDEVLDAAFARAGVLRVDSLSQLFDLAEALAKQPRPRGGRLSVLTNAGGPGVLAADALAGHGGELAALSEHTLASLSSLLPPHWSRGNPIDLLGDATADRYAKALEVALADPGADGLLAILSPQAMSDPTATARALASLAKEGRDKTLLACWMGGPATAEGEAVLQAAGIPCLPYPDEAAALFCRLWDYSRRLQALYETPELKVQDDPGRLRVKKAAELAAAAKEAGRCLLSEHESKALLQAYGIPVASTRLAHSAAEAAKEAASLGFPVALKLHSFTLTHKAEVGGVRLNLKDAAAVSEAFDGIRRAVEIKAGPRHFQGVSVQPMARREGLELILGMSTDPQFGPVLLFGAGGSQVGLWRDKALGLPPLNSTLARRLMEQTRIFEALKGSDLRPLEELLVRFSHLVLELPRLKEIEINPLLASPGGLLALDARVLLHPWECADEGLPRSAIRPYPAQYVQPWKGAGGADVSFRPIRPEDEPLLAKFHETLSERSVYLRYFQVLKLDQRVAHKRMVRACMNDFDRQICLVAEHRLEGGGSELVAVGRLTRLHARSEAEFALLVADAWQGKGLGTDLLKRLLEVGKEEGLKAIRAEMFSDNGAMREVCSRLGFSMASEGSLLKARLELG